MGATETLPVASCFSSCFSGSADLSTSANHKVDGRVKSKTILSTAILLQRGHRAPKTSSPSFGHFSSATAATFAGTAGERLAFPGEKEGCANVDDVARASLCMRTCTACRSKRGGPARGNRTSVGSVDAENEREMSVGIGQKLRFTKVVGALDGF